MPLEFRRKRNGRIRNTWFGAFEIDGKRHAINLGVRIGGKPPASLSLREEGDTAFERSRASALAKLNGILEAARNKRNAVALAEKAYELNTGEPLPSVRLKELAAEWVRLPRKRKPSTRYLSQGTVTLDRFVEFVGRENGRVTEIGQVTRTLARAFMEAEAKRGVTARTWNDTLSLLRTTFKALAAGGMGNPFLEVPTRETDTVFRHAFSPEELRAIVETAHEDDFIRPLLVTGMCTAMRRGDCCLLKWKDIDLEKRFITVKTAKTRQTVSIPIFPLLFDELSKNASKRQDGEIRSPKAESRKDGNTSTPPSPQAAEGVDDGGYVFPKQARMYLENPSGITWRVKKVLAVALMGKAEIGKLKAEMKLPEVSADEARKRGQEHICTLPEGEKRDRMARAFNLYMEGKSLNQVVQASGISKASVSGYLKEIEKATGCRFVRGRPNGRSMAVRLKAQSGLLLAAREGGRRRASVRDFHSFRVTWVTLALTAGVPLELVQKVTGHKTTDIVLKHYFQPGREDFRMALQSAMPKLLTGGGEKQKSGKQKAEMAEGGGQKSEDGGQRAAKEEMREMLNEVKPKALRQRLLKIWEKW